MTLRRRIIIMLYIVALLVVSMYFYLTINGSNPSKMAMAMLARQTLTSFAALNKEKLANLSSEDAEMLLQLRGDFMKETKLDLRDFYQRDLVKENDLVDKLSPLLKTNLQVINEAQRIQENMFKALIGRYKYAMLFNYAAFENKGDPAITVGELTMVQKLGLELVFHCETLKCMQKTADHAKNISERYTTNELVILMHGGGNLVSYTFEDDHRKIVLERFPQFEVILFPQSIWQKASQEHIQKFNVIYSKHKYLTFLYRERNSYILGKRLFPTVKAFIMPDMAFQIGAVERFIAPAHDILWLQRGDGESTKYKIPDNAQGYDIVVADWWSWKTPKGNPRLEDPILIAANGMMFLQRGRVVITDRLHGHILSVLCGIPHVIIDPVNHKISSYMQSWTGGIENIVLARDSEDALNKAIDLLRRLHGSIPKRLAFKDPNI